MLLFFNIIFILVFHKVLSMCKNKFHKDKIQETFLNLKKCPINSSMSVKAKIMICCDHLCCDHPASFPFGILFYSFIRKPTGRLFQTFRNALFYWHTFFWQHIIQKKTILNDVFGCYGNLFMIISFIYFLAYLPLPLLHYGYEFNFCPSLTHILLCIIVVLITKCYQEKSGRSTSFWNVWGELIYFICLTCWEHI